MRTKKQIEELALENCDYLIDVFKVVYVDAFVKGYKEGRKESQK